MNYWLDLFTGTTWDEFQKAGAKVTGFREHNWTRSRNIAPGDVFLCYLTGVKRWVGLLEVTGERFRDDKLIWGEELFPVRFPVKPLVLLRPEHGIPMKDFEGKLTFYPMGALSGAWTGHLRSSPTKYKSQDGKLIADALSATEANPISRPVDAKLLARSSNLYKHKKRTGDKEVEEIVAVPPTEEEEETPSAKDLSTDAPTHTEIQWRLLDLGSQMGLNVWAPKADRGKAWNGKQIREVPRLLDSLPTQFDEATNGTIENIDVLWLKGNAIVAAFEVEHTTSVYSGLLRMSDLLTMQPNIDIKLYLAAPDERFAKFRNEVPRPTFASRSKPLHTVCGFLPYSALCTQLEKAQDFLCHLKPDFIDDIAEMYDPAEEFDA
jgi:hypothetical protein